MSLFLLDANVVFDANNYYYTIERIPKFWKWLEFHFEADQIKIPYEIYYEEIIKGSNPSKLDALVKEREEIINLDEVVDQDVFNIILDEGYGKNLTDVELKKIGQDPILIAYAYADKEYRSVVTRELSAPSKIGKNPRCLF